MIESIMAAAPTAGYVDFVTVDATGRILNSAHMPESMFKIQVPPDGCSLVLGLGDPETHYVAGGAVAPRPACPAVLDGMTLTNLPAPCTITLEGVDYACADDTCELSFSHAGAFSVKVTPAWPMLDATFEVTQA
jgi:hypothetical protein